MRARRRTCFTISTILSPRPSEKGEEEEHGWDERTERGIVWRLGGMWHIPKQRIVIREIRKQNSQEERRWRNDHVCAEGGVGWLAVRVIVDLHS